MTSRTRSDDASPSSLPEQTGELFGVFYAELRQLAQRQLRGKARNQTLNLTALVNEAYIKLSCREQRWESEEHFLRTAARAIRQIIIDHARSRKTSKRGASFERITFDGIHMPSENNDVDLLQLDSVLTELENDAPDLAQIVELRYFCGLTVEETSQLVGISPSTVKRNWNYARAWLYERMTM